MPTPCLIFASERSAARLFDMKTAEFRELVKAGALPGSVRIGGFERWRVADLEAVASGRAMQEDFET